MDHAGMASPAMYMSQKPVVFVQVGADSMTDVDTGHIQRITKW